MIKARENILLIFPVLIKKIEEKILLFWKQEKKIEFYWNYTSNHYSNNYGA